MSVLNRLAHATSPYLQQHANNPVDWWEWGEPAFAAARSGGKPIFLSIGYSTCHWCHVMAHESFADSSIAQLLNANFVCIKVDREERPELDRIYLAYVQAVTGQAGWPLSVWLTPELHPFFGGTYFPPADRPGRPGLPTVIRSIAEGWRQDQARVIGEGQRVVAALGAQHRGTGLADTLPDLTEPAGDAFEQAYTYLFDHYDVESGGFGEAPKFPRAANLNFLLRCAVLQGRDSESGREAIEMVGRTLAAMSRGGIHDHVGGGFHRYAVDAQWAVPHFEKMLYDQALVAGNCIEAHALAGDERLAWTARDSLDYVLRDLRHEAGGLFAGESADSSTDDATDAEVREGAYYVWREAEIRAVLGESDAAWFCDLYGIKPEGNVPTATDPQGELRGCNVLHQQASLALVATAHGLEPEQLAERLSLALAHLRQVRDRRPRPARDEKIVAAWNGLAIVAMAQAATSTAQALRPCATRYRAAAVAAGEFVRAQLWDEDTQTLQRSWRDGRGSGAGYAEDYAAMIAAALALHEMTLDLRWLRWADELQAQLDGRFWDEAGGGYFQSEPRADVVLRLKDESDGAEPAANSLAAANLFRLAALLHDTERQRRGLQTLQALRPVWEKTPWALPALLSAMEWALTDVRQIVICGEPTHPAWSELVAVARHADPRRAVLLALSGGPDEVWLRDRVPTLAAFPTAAAQTPRVQVCREFQCEEPVWSPDVLENLLQQG